MVGIPLTRPDYHAGFRGQVVGAIEAAISEVPGAEVDVILSPFTKEQELEGIIEATNFLAEKCVAEGYDFLWIVEADVEVPKVALYRLLRVRADVALGIYPTHQEGALRMMAGHFEVDPEHVKPIVRSDVDALTLRNNVFRGMVWAGVGCALISRRVLESLRFVYDYEEYGQKAGVHDQLFLFEAQLRGFRVLLHGGVLCGHLPEWPLHKAGGRQ